MHVPLGTFRNSYFFLSFLSREIVVNRNDDDGVSTLGEPMVVTGGMQHMMQSDEPTAR